MPHRGLGLLGIVYPIELVVRKPELIMGNNEHNSLINIITIYSIPVLNIESYHICQCISWRNVLVYAMKAAVSSMLAQRSEQRAEQLSHTILHI